MADIPHGADQVVHSSVTRQGVDDAALLQGAQGGVDREGARRRVDAQGALGRGVGCDQAVAGVEPEAREQLDQLPKTIIFRVQRLLERLEHWPTVSGAKALRGNLAGKFRLRTGDYRLRFRVQEDRVIVDKIGHRSKFYE